MSEIIVVIDSQGNPTISVKGAKGKECQDLTKNLETALGTVKSDVATREMWEESNERNSNRNRT